MLLAARSTNIHSPMARVSAQAASRASRRRASCSQSPSRYSRRNTSRDGSARLASIRSKARMRQRLRRPVSSSSPHHCHSDGCSTTPPRTLFSKIWRMQFNRCCPSCTIVHLKGCSRNEPSFFLNRFQCRATVAEANCIIDDTASGLSTCAQLRTHWLTGQFRSVFSRLRPGTRRPSTPNYLAQKDLSCRMHVHISVECTFTMRMHVQMHVQLPSKVASFGLLARRSKTLCRIPAMV